MTVSVIRSPCVWLVRFSGNRTAKLKFIIRTAKMKFIIPVSTETETKARNSNSKVEIIPALTNIIIDRYQPLMILNDVCATEAPPRGNKSTARMAPDYQRSMIVGWPRLLGVVLWAWAQSQGPANKYISLRDRRSRRGDTTQVTTTYARRMCWLGGCYGL